MDSYERRGTHLAAIDRCEAQNRRVVAELEDWFVDKPVEATEATQGPGLIVSTAVAIDQMGPLILIGVWLGIAVFIAI